MTKSLLFLFLLVVSTLIADDKLIQNDYVKLSKEELNFIQSKKINVITSKTWAPFNMMNEDGQLSGIATSFWELIANRANLNSEITIARDWNTVLNKIKSKESDITLGTTFDLKKRNYALFTIPYISFPIAFATLFDKRFIPNETFLKGKKIAIGENYSSYVVLKNKYPNLDFILVKNTHEALKLLSAGEVDVAVDVLPVIAHLISKNGYSNLKIAGTSDLSIDISFMIRKDYPELQKVMNRHISLLTPEDKNTIIKQWLTVKFEKSVIDKEILINLVIVVFLFILFFIYRHINNKKHKEELEFLSNTDALTGLKNRRKIDNILNTLINKKFSIIIMDIDNFKDINDHFGHLLGDEILINIAELLKYNVNKTHIIGRWGGDEFLIICENSDLEEANISAQKIRKMIEEYNFKVKDITSSFGLSQALKHEELKHTLARADKALFQAKKEGKNRVISNKEDI